MLETLACKVGIHKWESDIVAIQKGNAPKGEFVYKIWKTCKNCGKVIDNYDKEVPKGKFVAVPDKILGKLYLEVDLELYRKDRGF